MTRQRMPEEQRQQQIMEAAARAGAADGMMHLTLRRVAEEAQVSHGLVVHHFGSKEGLQAALLEWLIGELLSPVPVPTTADPPQQQLLAIIREQLQGLKDKTDLIGLLLEFRVLGRRNESLRPRVRAELNAIHRLYLPLVTLMVSGDPDRYRDTSAIAIARAIGDLLIGYEINRFANPDVQSEEELIAAIAALIA